MKAPIIELSSVSHTYAPPGAPPFLALENLSFSVESGSFVAILGRSGSGKSTLLNLLAGLDRPSGGRVRVAGAAVNEMSEPDLARWRGRTMGIVFQFFQLLPTLTVQENILLAMELVGHVEAKARGLRARALLELVGIWDQADKLPSTLSGGQKQRAAIARALANEPSILMADEPTGNLDSTSTEAVMEVFETLQAQGVTLIVVTHDPQVAARAGRVLELVDGRLSRDS